jgi:hypothetical protein
MITGKSGSTQGARIVKIPAKKAIKSKLNDIRED